MSESNNSGGQKSAQGDRSEIRVLLVEDNPENQDVGRMMLERLGFAADIACNGQEALDTIAIRQYALVLMDCQMPIMDGLEASREIRARHPELKSMPIVAMTASAMAGDREKCMAAGMNDYITKPVRLATLKEMLERWLG